MTIDPLSLSPRTTLLQHQLLFLKLLTSISLLLTRLPRHTAVAQLPRCSNYSIKTPGLVSFPGFSCVSPLVISLIINNNSSVLKLCSHSWFRFVTYLRGMEINTLLTSELLTPALSKQLWYEGYYYVIVLGYYRDITKQKCHFWGLRDLQFLQLHLTATSDIEFSKQIGSRTEF